MNFDYDSMGKHAKERRAASLAKVAEKTPASTGKQSKKHWSNEPTSVIIKPENPVEKNPAGSFNVSSFRTL